MKTPERTIGEQKVLMVPVENLFRGAVQETLFPGARDWSDLREEINRNGYKLEHAIVARPCRQGGKRFEVIDGLGRVTIAREAGVEKISAAILEMNDEEAFRYVAEANLYRRGAVAKANLVQTIVLAKTHESLGGTYRVEPILRVCGVSEPTYTRAHASLLFAVEKLREDFKELKGKSFAEAVSEAVRRDLWQDFTHFYTGEQKVKTFWKKHYLVSPRAQEESRKQSIYKSGSRKAKPEKTSGNTNVQAGHGAASADPAGVLLAFIRMGAMASFARHYSQGHDVAVCLEGRTDSELQHVARYAGDLCAQIKKLLGERKRARAKTSGNSQAALMTPSLFEPLADTSAKRSATSRRR
ncbi:MAG: ParB N-terminal domain-containing protein [Acidobacteria bacterium]|nr:ParB N-terminal domain-containing protein [Acidobacteriota bacterium]